RTDRITRRSEIFEVPCGARLASKCKPCATRNRKLRIAQITAGWHLPAEPPRIVAVASKEVKAMMLFRANLLLERETLNYLVMPLDERVVEADRLDAGIAEVDEWLAGHEVRGTLAKPTTKARATSATSDGDGEADDGEAKPARVARSTKRREDAGE